MPASTRVAAALAALAMSGCGGGSSSPAPIAVAPAPSPAPTPTATPTPAPTAAASPLERLKAAAGAARGVVPLSVTVTMRQNASAFASPFAIAADDPNLRLLGGRYARGSGDLAGLALYPQAVTAGDAGLLSGTGLPARRYGINNGLEFALPAGQSQFELVLLSAGGGRRLQLLVDGAATNADGYAIGQVNNGNIDYISVTLPASPAARRVRAMFGERPILGLRFPGPVTLAPLPASNASVVFQGDSITEGSGASDPEFAWPVQAAYRLGIDDPINVGLGGSGYLARRSADQFVFGQRVSDVVGAVSGGPPDAVVVAGGINDCSVAPGGPFTPAQVGAAALDYFRALRAAAPQMLIFVLGPFTDYNNPTYSATSAACRDAIFASAREVAMTYTIDVAGWVTPANRDTVFNGTSNGPHPVDAGHAIYGQRAAEAIRPIIQGL